MSKKKSQKPKSENAKLEDVKDKKTQSDSKKEIEKEIEEIDAQIKELETQDEFAKEEKLETQDEFAKEEKQETQDESAKEEKQETQDDSVEQEEKSEEDEKIVPKKASKAKKAAKVIGKVFLFFVTLIIFAGIAGFVFAFSVVRDVPPIDTRNIGALLHEHSVIYDVHGNVLDSIVLETRRTNVSFECLPDNLINAFIAVEDRTFWEHSGFNVTRIIGAIMESLESGDRIRGTSTITQQLARNLFLMEIRTEYSIQRKIIEAYYALLLERDLSKEEIITAYLNRVYLGFGTSGVQAAAQAYFGVDVGDLTLSQSVALAAIVQEPHAFTLIRTLPNAMVDYDDENILYRDNTFTFLSNVQASEPRRHLILWLMREQGFITYQEYRAAREEDLRDSLREFVPGERQNTSFFIDFVTRQVVEDLAVEFDITEAMAWEKLFNGGLRIHTTFDPYMQEIIEREFLLHNNFPRIRNLSTDRAGNILRPEGGGILLHAFGNMFDAYGYFTLQPHEFSVLDNGDVMLYRGHRLNFFRTQAHGTVDYTINFRSMFLVEDGVFHTIREGVIVVPAQYKYRDSDGNLIIEARFFSEHPQFFIKSEYAITVGPANYRLNQRVIQPQAAMVIIDYETGHIRAMEGGRDVVGRMLHNRATSPRQPGSAIKTTAVYAAALQASADEVAGRGEFVPQPSLFDNDINFRGRYWTASTIINDSPTRLGGDPWPRNFDRTHRGAMSMRASLIQSVNVNAVKVFSHIGADVSAEFLRRLGVTTIVEYGNVNDMNAAALALGGMTHGISPLEMAVSYGVFANAGRLNAPVAYTKVTNRNGDILLQNIPQNLQVVDECVAFIMTDILRTTVSDGFARRASVSGRVVAGKTGTTNDNFDAWFVGMSSGYVASVWIGNDLNMPLSEGSLAAARLWSTVMTQVLDGRPDRPFPSRPENVVRAGGEYFVAGTQGSPFMEGFVAVAAPPRPARCYDPYCLCGCTYPELGSCACMAPPPSYGTNGYGEQGEGTAGYGEQGNEGQVDSPQQPPTQDPPVQDPPVQQPETQDPPAQQQPVTPDPPVQQPPVQQPVTQDPPAVTGSGGGGGTPAPEPATGTGQTPAPTSEGGE